ncbi:hypothetical protein LOTGIDRAFT_204833 [Lottia gigantea]|uniref:Glycoside hydrolase family 2 catalytic domain-containing protein n=1 Tax=Lottia gigantea TaxID=225164 RepID=V3ZGT5_LOTGI|nr:hypothetical protein LOTGIDRAFT_204833 [Lottia gigantea]ESO83347.1 hypothetical protein LOTGIDRAFT_204833 [Lottia gigantea]
MVFLRLIFAVAALTTLAVEGGRLYVSNGHFMKDGKRVFLSGINLAWIHYGWEYGNGNFQRSKPEMERYMKELHDAGGNSMRVWVFFAGESVPIFSQTGHVTKLDNKNTFISDFKEMTAIARKYDILLFPCLWNAAKSDQYTQRLAGIIYDETKLNSFIDNALVPLVTALKDDPAIGGWDLMNEPEGLANTQHTEAEPCFSSIKGVGGWAKSMFPFRLYGRFFNWAAAAIKKADPKALVTIGTNVMINTDQMGRRNYFSDHCLIKAGGKKEGTLDFYQWHSYTWQGHFNSLSPFKHSASEYKLDKPLVIGEFSAKASEGMSSTQMYHYSYNHGYQGAWIWSATDKTAGTSWSEEKKGVSSIRHESKNGVTAINV